MLYVLIVLYCLEVEFARASGDADTHINSRTTCRVVFLHCQSDMSSCYSTLIEPIIAMAQLSSQLDTD